MVTYVSVFVCVCVCVCVSVSTCAHVYDRQRVSPLLQSSVGCHKSQKPKQTQRSLRLTKKFPSQEKTVKCYVFSGSTLNGRTSTPREAWARLQSSTCDVPAGKRKPVTSVTSCLIGDMWALKLTACGIPLYTRSILIISVCVCVFLPNLLYIYLIFFLLHTVVQIDFLKMIHLKKMLL